MGSVPARESGNFSIVWLTPIFCYGYASKLYTAIQVEKGIEGLGCEHCLEEQENTVQTARIGT